jgi:hypothetical protein
MKNPNPLRWLWLGVTALAIAGVFALMLVIGRAPQLKDLQFFQDFFHVALVVHVDLSVLLWFLCIGGYGWSMLAAKYTRPLPYWQSGGFYAVAAATALIALSPLDAHWQVFTSNYIPVLNNILFLSGLGLLGAGLVVVLLPLVPPLLKSWKGKSNEEILFLGAAFTTALALIAFVYSARLQQAGLAPEIRFNQLFWAGGHILQFSFTLLMMAAWTVLVETIGNKPLNTKFVHFACLLACAAAALSIAGFARHPFDSGDFDYYQTRIMIEFGGVGAMVLAVAAVVRLVRSPLARANRAYISTLVCSLVLFAAGGLLGVMIQGQNVTIPAHYHGAIVGITLALMGYAYVLLPRHGYHSVAATRLAFWQPIVYGAGQLMHIGGLAYSGGYGVLRKTPAGETPDLAPNVKAALGIMGLGGLLAIIGGLLFVVVMVLAYRARRVKETSPV